MTRNIRQPGSANKIINTGLGQKGEPGERGKDGSNSQVTRIVFVSSSKSPGELNGSVIRKDWDAEGSPKYDLKVSTGESVVYSQDGSIWTYNSANRQGGWVRTGTVSAELYTEPGPRGLKGDPGVDGKDGKDGLRGPTGDRGLPGAKGERGDDGLDGKDGLRGPKGERGQNGLTGPVGAVGLPGDKGERGLTGEPGQRGERGHVGLTGSKGEPGKKGEPGETPNAHLLPAALCTYNGVAKSSVYRHNVTNIKHLDGSGVYSFRLDHKLNSSNTFVLVSAEGEGFFAARVKSQTDRIIVVESINLQTNEPADCTIKLMVYDTRG